MKPSAPVQEWEEDLWDDLAIDPSGNVMRKKQNVDGSEKWDVVSNEDVKERRRLQEYTDWPLSARAAAQ